MGRGFIAKRRVPSSVTAWTIAVASVVAVVAVPADAGNFSGATGGTGCTANNMSDSTYLSYIRISLTSKMQSAVADTLANDIDPTDIVLLTEHYSESSGTDVVYYDADYSTYCGFDWHPDGPDPDSDSVIGMAECVSLVGSDCDKFRVRFDTSFTNSASNDTAKTLACHETGHAVGLLHQNGSGCMPATLPTNAHFFNVHDVAHLNSNY